MFLLVPLFLAGCGDTPSADPPAPAPAPAAASPAAHDHAGAHAAGGGHMADMAATRDELRKALGTTYDQPVPGLDQADPARGKAAYDKACASCHGAAGKGDGPAGAGLTPPPADFTDAFHARFYSDAARVHIVRKGIQGTAMAAFEGTLSEPEILEVYAYVKSLRPAAGTGTPEHDHAAHGH